MWAPSWATARGRCEAMDPENRAIICASSSPDSLTMFLKNLGQPCLQSRAVFRLREHLHLPLSSRACCILPLAVNAAPGQSLRALMTCRFWLATLSRTHSQPAATTVCQQMAEIIAITSRCHCSPGFSLRWPSHGGGGTRDKPGGHEGFEWSILDT